MSFTKTLFGALAATTLLASAALAEGIVVNDPYARVSAKMSASGAAFMIIENQTGEADRLIDAKSDVSEKVELHTHKEDDQGVMRMIHVEEGFDLPADGKIEMVRGGHHVMFLGLKEPLENGDVVPVTLVFEKAGEVQIDVPVDLDRMPMHGKMMDHSKMDHSKMGHGQMGKGKMMDGQSGN